MHDHYVGGIAPYTILLVQSKKIHFPETTNLIEANCIFFIIIELSLFKRFFFIDVKSKIATTEQLLSHSGPFRKMS